jgi:dipeptidyl aminopeptidase/acylaminoacyl peptidase
VTRRSRPEAPPTFPSQPAPFGASPQTTEILDLEGHPLSTIAGLPPDASGLGISADGSLISFVTNPGSLSSRLAIVSSDGTGMRLVDTPDVFIEDSASTAPSPDGSEVAFEGVVQGQVNPDIFVVGVDGAGLRRLTDDAGLDQFPRWSPDGSTVAYDSAPKVDMVGEPTIPGDPTFYSTADIWTVPAAGGTPTQLTDGHGPDTAPSFSPDGSRIVYSHAGKAWTMNADGSAQRPLSGDPACIRPSWSPDGSEVACAHAVDAPGRATPQLVDVARSGELGEEPLLDLVLLQFGEGPSASFSRTSLAGIEMASTSNPPLWLPDGQLLVRRVTPR